MPNLNLDRRGRTERPGGPPVRCSVKACKTLFLAGLILFPFILPSRSQTVLFEGDEGVLAPPAANFRIELRRIIKAGSDLSQTAAADDPDASNSVPQINIGEPQSGAADAAAALGREGRLWLMRTNYERALDLYLQQFAADDASAYGSVCAVMRKLIRGSGDEFSSLVKNPRTRRVVTAYFISTQALRISSTYEDALTDTEASNHVFSIVHRWLAAAREAQVADPETIEELALVAYQNGQSEAARYWIGRAGASPTARWIQAKILLSDGRIAQGLGALQRVAALFPLGGDAGTNGVRRLEQNLTTPFDNHYYWGSLPAPERIRAELGAIHLSRGDYTAALDCLREAGLAHDVAYVAEDVLSTTELQAYVDAHVPRNNASQEDADLRYLLARRLTRELRGCEARDYFPEQWLSQFDALTNALVAGWDESAEGGARAEALFAAARLASVQGMDLLGTELGPDWRRYGGSTEGYSASERTNEQFVRFAAGADELQRAREHVPDPNVRFHYRYQAAFLGWEAAKLMPDNSDDTAHVLYVCGSWLKDRDPQTADIFYKALVRRCRKTALGDEADRRRWFPELDADGNFKTPRLEAMAESAQESAEAEDASIESVPEYPMPGENYIVHSGDTLQQIAAAASAWGNPVSIDDLRQANPGLAAYIRIGQKIMIPKPTEDGP
jgi:hypothetical protein